MTTRILASVCLSAFLLSGCGTEPQVTDRFVRCRSLDGDRTAIPVLAWEFEAVSAALTQCPCDALLTANEISDLTLKHMAPELRDSLQNAEASIRTVLLELEVRGIFVRADQKDGDSLIRLRRT